MICRSFARLTQPSGQVEKDETLTAAAERETFEETGWSVEVTDLLHIDWMHQHDSQRSVMRVAFVAQAKTFDATHPLDTGIVRAVWIDWDTIQNKREQWRSPAVGAAIESYRAGRRWPIDILCQHTLDCSL